MMKVFFPILWYQKFGTFFQKERNISLIFTRKGINSKIHPKKIQKKLSKIINGDEHGNNSLFSG
jgi:hypothetical protein